GTGRAQWCMRVGAAASAIGTGWLLGIVHWPWVFLIFAVPGVIWSVWFYWWFRDRPADHSSLNEAERALLKLPADFRADLEAREPTPWLRLFTRPKLIWICTQQFFPAAANV